MKTKKSFNLNAAYEKYGMLIVLAIEIIFFSFSHPNFLTSNNLLSVGRQVSFIGISSIGMTIVMLTGGIDISVGSLLAFIGVMAAKMTADAGIPVAVAIIIVLVGGTLIGVFNGTMVKVFKVPALIATLAMQTTLKGVTFLTTNAIPVSGIPDSFKFLGQGLLAGVIPVPLLVLVVLFIAAAWFLAKTYFGRWIYAIGGNETAAQLSGINTTLLSIVAYAMCGFFTSIAGVLMAGRLSSGQPQMGADFPMDVLTATVLGGVSVNGGKGNVMNVLVGAFVMGILSNGVIMVGLNDYWQWVIKGIVLLVAVAVGNINAVKKK